MPDDTILPGPLGDTILTNEEIEAWLEVFPGTSPSQALYDTYRSDRSAFRAAIINEVRGWGGERANSYLMSAPYAEWAAEGAQPGPLVAFNRSMGIQESTRAQTRAAGYQTAGVTADQVGTDCGCNGQGGGFCVPGNLRTNQLYPACRVPQMFRMTHQSVRGRHNCYLGPRLAACFTRKASANAFCRSWNEMMKHLGSAENFRIADLTSIFNAVIAGGSGQWGLENGFDPPMHGE